MDRRGLSRRGLLRAAGGLGFAGASAAVLPLFGQDGAQQDPAACAASDASARDASLVVSNWPGYIDPRKPARSTFQRFQESTGITVDYTNDVNDNAEFYARVRNQLGSCEPVGRDLMVLTDWMAARMISLGWTRPRCPACATTSSTRSAGSRGTPTSPSTPPGRAA